MHIVKFTKTLALTVVLGNKEDLAVAEDFFQTVDKSDGLLRLHAVFISENIVVTMNGVVVPRPWVGKRLCLGTVLGADVVVYLVVVAFGIERRIDVAKINRLVADKLPHHIKIVAVKEFVHITHHNLSNCNRLVCNFGHIFCESVPGYKQK